MPLLRTSAVLLLAVQRGACSVASPLAAAAPMRMNEFTHGELGEGLVARYRVFLPPASTDVKVVCLPERGDADVLVSFDRDAAAADAAGGGAWQLEGVGAEELTLRRDSGLFCKGLASCYLYLTVTAFEAATVYKVGVLEAHRDPAAECAPGCAAALLDNAACDLKCNVTACAHDHGACLPRVSSAAAAACSPGCDPAWLADGYCDEACFTEACAWDLTDCVESDTRGCANGCLGEYVDDGECDAACNVEECGWDGADCAHSAHGCYERADGADYRGQLNVTASGLPCQAWSRQYPQQHFYTHARYPAAGLGAHAYCRNPAGLHHEPWCYTAAALTRWERCDVGAPADGGCAALAAAAHPAAVRSHAVPVCERLCAPTHARLAAGDCEAVDECACGGGVCAAAGAGTNATANGGPCVHERDACMTRRNSSDRLLLVLWIAAAGTSIFVMALLLHAARVTSPGGIDSPRSWHRGGGGYTGLACATPAGPAGPC